jgi:putative nucleotidyltransferase with HDIG domain
MGVENDHAGAVAELAVGIALELGWDDERRTLLRLAATLHDVGKVAISDAILHKPGRLTWRERAEMRRHPVIGEEIVRGIDFLGDARTVVRSHHERWDGGGYPDGLHGKRIPLAARVFAVADAFDALTSDRPYRAAASFEEARTVIRAGAGTQFDPDVAGTFDELPDERLDEIRVTLA